MIVCMTFTYRRFSGGSRNVWPVIHIKIAMCAYVLVYDTKWARMYGKTKYLQLIDIENCVKFLQP